jgi:hypothetical protein
VATAVGPLAVTDSAMADGLLAPGTDVWLTFSPRGLALLRDGPP